MNARPIQPNADLRVYAVHIYPGESWFGPDGAVHTNNTKGRIDIDPHTSMPFDAETSDKPAPNTQGQAQ